MDTNAFDEIRKITGIKFSILNKREIQRLSCVDVNCSSLSSNKTNTLMDDRLGTINSLSKCPTCSLNSDDCSGHFGKIELDCKIIHPFFLNFVLNILKQVCLECTEVLMDCKECRPKCCPQCKIPTTKIAVKELKVYSNNTHLSHADIERIIMNIDTSDWRKKLKMVIHKQDLFIETLIVPPTRLRPYNNILNIKHHDECTTKLLTVLKNKDNEHEAFSCLASYVFMDSVTKSRGRSSHSLESKSIASRWKGKKGRIRGNLMGKRINFTARTVISPGPDIALNEVGVPKSICDTLMKPVHITAYNICTWQAKINAKHPSIKYVIRTDKQKIFVPRCKYPVSLRIGYIVYRTLQDGDWVLMNRQPTLHRHSIMAHKVKVVNTQTFKLNLSVTTPYNADFDGDEMNLHCIQGNVAEAEANEILNVNKQLGGSQSSCATMALVQDSMLGIFLLGLPDVYLAREDVMDLIYDCPPAPTILKPQLLWSGRSIISTILPSYFSYQDDSCYIKRGKIIHGNMTKKIFGVKGVVYSIVIMEGSEAAAEFIMKAQHLARRYLDLAGACVTPRFLVNAPSRQIEKSKAECTSQSEPLADLADTISRLSNTRDSQDMVENMVNSGSKGKAFNLMQIKGCVGTQVIMGKPFKSQLPCYTSKTCKKLQDFGFVSRSYSIGLKEEEYFLHCISGREGIIDTSVKTADTGYLHRKITKSTESFHIAQDKTVRGHGGYLLQFRYGGDNLDAARLIKTKTTFMKKSQLLHDLKCWEEDTRDQLFSLCFGFMGHLFGETEKFYCPFDINLVADRKEYTDHTTFRPVPLKSIKQFFRIVLENIPASTVVHAHLMQCFLPSTNYINYSNFIDVGNKVIRLIQNSHIQVGEMVGLVAVGSVSEPCTQMSASYDTEVIVKVKKTVQRIRIGELVDKILRNRSRQSQEIPVSHIQCIGVSSTEKVSWARVTHVSRHPANGTMMRVDTAHGRHLEMTASHSFLVRQKNRVVAVKGHELKLGDALPIVKHFPEVEEEIDLPVELARYFGSTASRRGSLPVWILQTTDAFLSTLLQSYFDSGNGNVQCSPGCHVLRCFCPNRALIELIILCLARFGIPCFIQKRAVSTRRRRRIWEANIPVSYAKTFREYIGFSVDFKQRCLDEICAMNFEHQNTIPGISGLLYALRAFMNDTEDRRALRRIQERGNGITVYLLQSLLNQAIKNNAPACIQCELEQALTADVWWDTITSIKTHESDELVYDFTVSHELQSFMLANGVFVHNTLNTFHAAGVGNTTVSTGIPRLKDILDGKETNNVSLIVSDHLYRLYAAYLFSMQKTIVDVFSVENSTSSIVERILEFCEFPLDYVLLTIKTEYTISADHIKGVHFFLSRRISSSFIFWVTNVQCICNFKADDEIRREFPTENIFAAFTRERHHKTLESLLLPVSHVKILVNEGILNSKYLFTRDIVTCMNVFGLESTNRCIFKEITDILSSGGDVNPRHILLIADVMTLHGTLNGFNRHAMQKINSVNAFEHATFEQTIDVFKKAAFNGAEFNLNSASDTILCGQEFIGGTNLSRSVSMLRPSIERAQKSKQKKNYIKRVRTIIRKEWGYRNVDKDCTEVVDNAATVDACPLSPEYCPLSPEYCPTSPCLDTEEEQKGDNDPETCYDLDYADRLNGSSELMSNQVHRIDAIRTKFFNNLDSIFRPLTPDNDERTIEQLNEGQRWIQNIMNN